MSKTGGPTRTKIQREYDLEEVSALYLQGWVQVRIAEHINKIRNYDITQQTVSRDLKTIQERWFASSLRNFDEAKAQEIAKVDHLELVAWEAYQSSIKPIIKQKISKKVDGQTTEATQEAYRGYGDVRFLEMVYKCIDRRCKLLGLDAPVRQDVDITSGGNTLGESLERLIAKSYGHNSN